MRIPATVTDTLQPWFPSLPFDTVRIFTRGPVCWFVRAVLRRGAMTFSPFIFYGRAAYDPTSLSSVALLAHEMKHIEQYRRYGHLGFLGRYFWHAARNGFHYSRRLPLEAEAYTLQREVEKALGARLG